jgi:hypothetical protein
MEYDNNNNNIISVGGAIIVPNPCASSRPEPVLSNTSTSFWNNYNNNSNANTNNNSNTNNNNISSSKPPRRGPRSNRFVFANNSLQSASATFPTNNNNNNTTNHATANNNNHSNNNNNMNDFRIVVSVKEEPNRPSHGIKIEYASNAPAAISNTRYVNHQQDYVRVLPTGVPAALHTALSTPRGATRKAQPVKARATVQKRRKSRNASKRKRSASDPAVMVLGFSTPTDICLGAGAHPLCNPNTRKLYVALHAFASQHRNAQWTPAMYEQFTQTFPMDSYRFVMCAINQHRHTLNGPRAISCALQKPFMEVQEFLRQQDVYTQIQRGTAAAANNRRTYDNAELVSSFAVVTEQSPQEQQRQQLLDTVQALATQARTLTGAESMPHMTVPPEMQPAWNIVQPIVHAVAACLQERDDSMHPETE